MRPFIDLYSEGEKKDAQVLKFTSDPSKNGDLGFGAWFEKHQTYAQWPKGFIAQHDPSIEYLELYALTIAVYTWSKQLSNRRVTIFCDNEAVVHMVNNYASSCANCMVLIRLLVLRTLEMNFRIFVRHIKTQDNEISDSLSRLQWCRFQKLAKLNELRPVPEKIPRRIVAN